MQKQSYNIKSTLAVYWKHLNPFAGLVLLVVLLISAANIFDVMAPMYYKTFFDVLGSGGNMNEKADQLIYILFVVLGFHFCAWVTWRANVYINNYVVTKIKMNLETTAFTSVLHHSYAFFSNRFVGILVRRIHRLSNAFERLVDESVYNFIPLFVMLLGQLVVLYMRNVWLGTILLVWSIVIIAFNVKFAFWKLKFDLKKAELDSQTTAVLSDTLTNSTTIKVFTAETSEQSRFAQVMNAWRMAQKKIWDLDTHAEAIQGALMIFVEFGMMFAMVKLWQQQLVTIGDFALVQSYLLYIFGRIWGIGRAVRHVYESFADASEMVEILNTPQGVKDVPKAKTLQMKQAAIDFKNVSFQFNKTRSVLNHFDLSIAPKEKIALVGQSGAGKSTIVQLLLRFYDVGDGHVMIDGQDIAKVTQSSLRKNIAFVPQESLLFHRSIMENIRYGRLEATDAEVIDAAKRARCHEFIMELPDQYNTLVGERGIKLSGGERQRVAIARAILKDAPILVLDEATSSLDSESESLIQAALEELMRDKTTVVIAHRLSTIMRMDRIVVVDRGAVVDTGTHQDLLSKEGIYKKLWEIQVGGFVGT